MLISIIIPLYNEENTILDLLKKIESKNNINKQVIIVDDCSKDNSLNLVKEFNSNMKIDILTHEYNLGKGAAIKTAKNYIKGDIVIIQDADLEYNPDDYESLIDPIIKKKYKVVYGSRVLNKKRYSNSNFTSLIRVFCNHTLTIISNIINNQNLTDAHTCYKVFDSEIFKNINLVENKFGFCPEITTKISNLKHDIKEIPINYKGRTYEEGKKISIFDGFDALKCLIKYKIFK